MQKTDLGPNTLHLAEDVYYNVLRSLPKDANSTHFKRKLKYAFDKLKIDWPTFAETSHKIEE